MKTTGSQKSRRATAGESSSKNETRRLARVQDSGADNKYDVALSFAGEDREYVDAVASHLQEAGVRVFYDRFEETKLWGKNLYDYLSDIYQRRAMYTVVFISRAYRDKLWTNLERKAAQARAFSESREYLLPAIIDPDVEIPGVLKTIAYIDLKDLTPEDFAEKIIQKLQDEGVLQAETQAFNYGPDAKADIDFHLSGNGSIIKTISGLKSHDWYKQRPAVESIHDLKWSEVSHDEAFILGRNIYQCACGTERTALAFMRDLRRQLAKIPPDRAMDLLNGMFYEVYFDSKGEYRQDNLKSQHLAEIFAIQTVAKYAESIAFIRQALSPYRESLVVLPNTEPQIITVTVKIARKDPPLVRSVQCLGQEVLVDISEDGAFRPDKMWRLALKQFGVETLRSSIAEAWYVPLDQLKVEVSPALKEDVRMLLPKGKTITRPTP
jgi:hypothetical protein